jgi:DNA mismatch repair ATPase MutS
LQAGFPYFQIDRFLKILVQDMKKHVAISEEFSLDPSNRVKSGGLMFDRRVTRIVTPGTLIDEKFMNPWENNFILSIHQSGECQDRDGEQVTADLGVSWLDSSSGDFFIQQTNIASLSSVLARIGPREVVVDPDGKSEEIDAVLKDGQYNVSYHRSSHLDPRERWNRLVDDVGGLSLEKFSPVEIEAGSLILDYLSTQFQGNAPKLRPPLQRQKDEYMMIDKNSLKALEIRSTLREGSFEGSVLQAIRRTVTNSGNRLLLQRLSRLFSSCLNSFH